MEPPERIAESLVRDDLTIKLVTAAAAVMDVRAVQAGNDNARRPRGLSGSTTLQIFGRLHGDSDRAYAQISSQFAELGHVAMMRRVGNEDVVVASPGSLPVASQRLVVAGILFGLTLLSVLFVGTEAAPERLLSNPLLLLTGWPFAASLLGILLAHEFGHYVVARRLGVASSLPYFIPLPISLLGTMGAVIQMKAPPRNKRYLLAVAVAGPLCGFVVAIPVIVIGLLLSQVHTMPASEGVFLQEGNSILYAGLKMLVFGRFLPSGNEDVFLHPVALAGWAGLLVTGLNLLPAGQLDGGHIAYSLFGRRAHVLTYGVVATLLALSLLWREWLIWAALIFLFSRIRIEPLDDLTPLRPREQVLAVSAMVLLVLIFTPIPLVIG